MIPLFYYDPARKFENLNVLRYFCFASARFIKTGRRSSQSPKGKLGLFYLLILRSKQLKDLNIPGFRLHALKGKYKGYWSVWVTGNWRLIFRFEDGSVLDLDLVDYH